MTAGPTIEHQIDPSVLDGLPDPPSFEKRLLDGPVPVTFAAIELGHDVLRLYKFASFFHGDDTRDADPTVAHRYPPERIWGLSIGKISDYLERVLGAEFRTSTMMLSWANAMNATRTRRPGASQDGTADVALHLRAALAGSMRVHPDSPTGRAEAWNNFRLACAVLAPIFSGEVTRTDLSA